MALNIRNRSLLSLVHHTDRDLLYLLDLSRDLKRAKYSGLGRQSLAGKNIALIFEKTSTRTRCAFEVAAYDEGAHVTYIDPASSQIGHKESMKDTARVLGRMYDAIEYRGAGQDIVEELAEYAGVPVFNGLTDEFHPTQMLADVLTMTEHCPKPLTDIAFAFVGDGRNNVANSLLLMGAKLGMDVRIGAPQDLWPSDEHVTMCRDFGAASGARITITDDPHKAVSGVDFIYTDVWVSMGEPIETWGERIDLLLPFQVNSELMAATGNPRVKFMHCLPAFHNSETKVGATDRGAIPEPGQRHRSHRERLRKPGQHRLRSGREPHAHHQGGPRGRARAERHADRDRPRRQCVVAARATHDRGEPARQYPCGGGVHRRRGPGQRDRRGARQRPAGRPAGTAGRGVPRRRAVPTRRARRSDRGDDRLRHRTGTRQPAARTSSRSPRS